MRHGQTEWNRDQRLQGWQDSTLTSQAKEHLVKIPLPIMANPVVISSDLGRAVQTAAIIARRLECDVITDPRLRERQFGLFEGKVIDCQQELPDSAWRDYHARHRIPLGDRYQVEPEPMFEARIVEFTASLKAQYHQQDVLLVSHGEWIRALHNIQSGTPSWKLGQGIEANARPIIFDLG
ncbi:histidine phosphatase family protein [Vibrio sp. WXL210]|uniref:histidine phosphatase family protein n=1 Tax=Vibrio sp. WXL210 TaxID=3450709 RepID=UPI003EC4E735